MRVEVNCTSTSSNRDWPRVDLRILVDKKLKGVTDGT